MNINHWLSIISIDYPLSMIIHDYSSFHEFLHCTDGTEDSKTLSYAETAVDVVYAGRYLTAGDIDVPWAVHIRRAVGKPRENHGKMMDL